MSNLNLSEAAAEILNQSKAKAGAEPFGVGNPKASDEKKVKTPQQAELEIGTAGHKYTDSNYDATKGMGAQATLPTGKGVAGEPMHKLSGEPQQTQGRSDLTKDTETETETSDDAKRDRKKATLAAAKMAANPKAMKPVVPESEEEEEWEEPEEEEEFEDEEEVYEATIEEVMEDMESMDDEEFEATYGLTKEEASCKMSDDEDEDDEDEKEKKAEMKAKRKEKMKEDVDAMLSGENLSEEFRNKAAMIFEAAVEARVEELATELEEQFITEFNEAVETIKEDFADKLDSYLDYVVENWMAENELAVERGLRSEIVEDFIGALKNVFEEHYIDIPEDKTDVVEQLVDRVEELEDQINEQILKNIDLKKSISEHKKEEAVLSVCEGLSLTQVEKIKSLAKSVEFVSEEDFSEKLETIKESYFPSGVIQASTDSLNDIVELDEDENTTKVVDPLIEQYANIISKKPKF